MSSVSRTTQFAKAHKVLKKHYKPVVLDPNRSVMEHLLFACCLEDAHFEAAEEAYAALVHTFFDWNEVRVTTISELCEVMAGLPDPRAAANRLKRILQGIFEATYSFDLEEQKKKNLGPTVKWLEKIDGMSLFAVSYVVQAALGGHAIPIGPGEMRVLLLCDLVSDKDAESGAVPGLERAIPKSKGVEFGSLLHQLSADFTANPYAPQVREIILEINPEAKEQFPKRRAEKKPEKKEEPTAAGEAPATAAPAKPAEKKKIEERPAPAEKAEKHEKVEKAEKHEKAEKPAAPKAEKHEKAEKPEKAAEKHERAEKHSRPEKHERPEKHDKPDKPAAATVKEPPAEKHEKPHVAASEKPVAAKSAPPNDHPKKKSASEGLSKRKPR